MNVPLIMEISTLLEFPVTVIPYLSATTGGMKKETGETLWSSRRMSRPGATRQRNPIFTSFHLGYLCYGPKIPSAVRQPRTGCYGHTGHGAKSENTASMTGLTVTDDLMFALSSIAPRLTSSEE